MAIQYLKKGKNEADRAVDDVKVRGVVEDILKAIEERGDNAVREYSQKFDNYTPESYRLNLHEIDS